MVSIIICSINPAMLQNLYLNVVNTIGLPFEWLPFNNIIEKKGICEVYNIQASKSTNNNLIFIHEDIIFKKQNWGLELINTLKEFDFVGVAGSSYKSATFSGWATGQKDLDAYSVTHITNEIEYKIENIPNTGTSIYPAVILDGVFIACKKEVWSNITFNETLLKGFHAYDTDFSIRASLKGYKGCVNLKISISHITKDGGDFGDEWLEATILSQSFIFRNLPLGQSNYIKGVDILITKYWLDFLKNQNISFKNRLIWIKSQYIYRYPSLYYSILKFLLYKSLRLTYIHNIIKRP